MANIETAMGIGPQKSMFVLVIIVGCFAVLWPRILSPMFLGPPKDSLEPNSLDKTSGCCDVLYDSDVDAIKIMTELCGNILRSQSGGIDPKTEQAFQSGKLSKNIVNMCRQEVNKTCGLDIALFLNHNIALGRTFKQILEDIRSYNSSTCLKLNYGVAPWTLGIPHVVGKWVQELDSYRVRQERPTHLKHSPIHPALRERGRAIPPPVQSVPHPTVPVVPHTGRPIPMRPPMGSPGRVAAPPKSSVGFLMPLYTLCIVIFFFYTMFKLVFRKSTQEPVTPPLKYVPDKQGTQFRKTVFNKPEKTAPEPTKLVVSAISGLVAEVKQQMEEEYDKKDNALNNQDPPLPYTNGSVTHEQKEPSPILIKSRDFTLLKETTPPSWEASTPVHREETVLVEEFTPKEAAPEREPSLVKEPSSPLLKEDSHELAVVESVPKEEPAPEVEKIGTKLEEDLVVKLRSSVEKENATVKVMGMEMRAHCEGGKKWTSPRPPTPPVALPTSHAASHHPPGRTTPDVEVSSIYLEGALPHQSRLLVADSEIHTEKLTNGDDKDTPIVLSGKMTLSLINDTSSKSTPDRNYAVRDDSVVDDDEDFLTASATTAPKLDEDEAVEEGSEEEEGELEEDLDVVASNGKKTTNDRGESILTDLKNAMINNRVDGEDDEEESEDEIEYEEDDEVIEVVEEPKKDTATTQVVEDTVDDEFEEEEYEEEIEEEEEVELEPIEDKTESTSVEARRDNNTTISTSSDANTSKKVDVDDDEEEDEETDDEIFVEDIKTGTGGDVSSNKVMEQKTNNSIGASDNSISKELEDDDEEEEEYEEEEEDEYEEEEIEVEDDDDDDDDEIEEVEKTNNKHDGSST